LRRLRRVLLLLVLPLLGAGLLALPLLSAGCIRLPFFAGTPAGRQADEPKMLDVLVVGEKVELFMEHPYPVQGKETKGNVHLTVRKDGMPVRSGKLTLVVTGRSGKAVQVEQAAPRSPGIFGPVVAFPEAGRNEMVLTLGSEQAQETLRTPVTVYADEA